MTWQLPASFAHALLQGNLITDATPTVSDADVMLHERWVRDLAKPSGGLERVVLLEMEARLTRLALQNTETPVAATAPGRLLQLACHRPERLEQMAAFIAQNYREAINVQDIAAHVNLHPNYAMGLFRRVFGTTVIKYLIQHRISHAQRLLATTDAPIAEIALDSGFHSLSRFNQSFRAICRCTPRDYRKAHA